MEYVASRVWVFSVSFAVLWMMQQGIDVVKDVALRHLLAVACLELCQRPVGNVLAPVAAVLGVGVVGEALCVAYKMQVWNRVCRQTMEGLITTYRVYTEYSIF